MRASIKYGIPALILIIAAALVLAGEVFLAGTFVGSFILAAYLAYTLTRRTG